MSMKITKNQDHVFFKNKSGEYHISNVDYNKLGAEKALALAESEIQKKLSTKAYGNVTINFQQARDLGFCEYGIKDFAEMLELSLDKEYSIDEILTKLTPKAFLAYTSECVKLFTKDRVMAKFGGVKAFLKENPTREVLDFVLRNDFIDDKNLHLLACSFAENTLHKFEKEYPDDKRPRRAIEVKRLWIGEEYA